MKTPGELGKLFEQIAQPDAQGYSQAFSIEELAAICSLETLVIVGGQ